MKNKIVFFNSSETPIIDEIGGKAYSLAILTKHKLNIPPGFILPADFFQTWLTVIKKSPAFKKLSQSTPKIAEKLCNELKANASNLKFTSAQKDEIKKALAELDSKLYAVRSSSPEEDLDEASFAGQYETKLGVPENQIESAIKIAFASAFDYRVFKYKQEKRLQTEEPKIAVIIQEQIDSEKSGVCFSLNPINNCYDEAVINSNYGLGETVVSGKVSPDEIVMDMADKSVISRVIGGKSEVLTILKDGGTKSTKRKKTRTLTLSDKEALEIGRLTKSVEKIYNKPVDVEWTYAKNKLYLLQARPITTYLPLPPEMVTKPGEKKHLYWDATLGKQGINEPMSILGTDHFKILENNLGQQLWKGDLFADPKTGLGGILEGKMYQNLSNYMKGKATNSLANQIGMVDIASADIIRTYDFDEYIPEKANPALTKIFINMALKNLPTVWRGIKGFINPDKYKKEYQLEEDKFRQKMEKLDQKEMTIKDFLIKSTKIYLDYATFSIPTLITSEICRAFIKKLFKKERKNIREKTVYLERALPHNVTIQMGIAIHALANHPDIKKIKTPKEFISKLNKKELSEDFMNKWKYFMDNFGFRSPRELDLATPPYDDEPGKFFSRLKLLITDEDTSNDPDVIFETTKKERIKIYKELYTHLYKKSPLKATIFKKLYKGLVTFGGYREIHKYYLIYTMKKLRARIIAVAKKFKTQKRIDKIEDIFDLKFKDIEEALKNPKFSLKKRIEKNTVFYNKIRNIKNFPRIIDSRGKIFSPPVKKLKPGEIKGQSISPGIVIGKIKILHTPDEKPLYPGEILVAKATDPGWTPLFTNAGGIILEVGGTLQHGALVAREYGKPCIVGIENATEKFKDGQKVEMNGLTGTIKTEL